MIRVVLDTNVLVSASILVTGNLKHFPEQLWGDARVLAPRSFIDQLLNRE